LQRIRGETPIILAGGCSRRRRRSHRRTQPNVVDVSSPEWKRPGIKDHERMRAFRDAVAHASIPT
jgi:phosphoribosylanthranilate isomerase